MILLHIRIKYIQNTYFFHQLGPGLNLWQLNAPYTRMFTKHRKQFLVYLSCFWTLQIFVLAPETTMPMNLYEPMVALQNVQYDTICTVPWKWKNIAITTYNISCVPRCNAEFEPLGGLKSTLFLKMFSFSHIHRLLCGHCSIIDIFFQKKILFIAFWGNNCNFSMHTSCTSFWIFEHFASQWAAYYQRGWGFDRDLDIKQDPIFHTAAAAVVGASGLSQPLMTWCITV